MDKNTWIGFLLIAAIIVGFNIINRPSEEEIAERQRIQDSIAVAQKMEAEAQAVSQQIAQQIDAEVPEETNEDLNQVDLPDPIAVEMECLRRRIVMLENKLREHEKGNE